MIIDRIENIEKYLSLHPLFAQAIEFLKSAQLQNLEPGRIVLKKNDLYVNVDQTTPKRKEDAKLETHNCFIDIQLPLSNVETIGYAPRAELDEAVYEADRDITFYDTPAADYFLLKPGMFAVFFPEDAHAPAITEKGVKKIVIKVRVN